MRVWNRRDPNTPPNAVYVGRGTPWGNPFVIGKHGDRDAVCDRFEREVLPSLDVAPLVGRDLVCWCAPRRCHADALQRKAIATEARRAETVKQGSVHEGAGRDSGIAQPSSGDTSNE